MIKLYVILLISYSKFNKLTWSCIKATYLMISDTKILLIIGCGYEFMDTTGLYLFVLVEEER